MKHWNLDDIDWSLFDRTRIDDEIVPIVKAASMVEFNGGVYADYLCNIFHDDEAFKEAARNWAQEEVQHGEALRRWAELADPSFDFDASFKRFADTITLPMDIDRSVRGSLSGELVARCVVEIGTSSYYSALADSTDEPVLKEICQRIAADELRHYRLFYQHLKRYQDIEQLGVLKRLRVALGRIAESEDDELAFALRSGFLLPGLSAAGLTLLPTAPCRARHGDDVQGHRAEAAQPAEPRGEPYRLVDADPQGQPHQSGTRGHAGRLTLPLPLRHISPGAYGTGALMIQTACCSGQA